MQYLACIMVWVILGQIKGKLVAIGGKRRSNCEAANEGYTYDEQSREWIQTIPSMPTARHSPGVVSLKSALVVASGDTSYLTYTNNVEIFKPDTSQWYRTDPLPTNCMDISIVTIGNMCYVLGGYVHSAHLNQVLYASVDDLLHNVVRPNQTMTSSSDRASAWRALPSTPTYRSTVAVLAGNLLAIGGKESSRQESPDEKKVYAYSPSANSWIYISDLPAARSQTAVAVLSSTEILVIGGHIDGYGVNTVYKGTLHLKL